MGRLLAAGLLSAAPLVLGPQPAAADFRSVSAPAVLPAVTPPGDEQRQGQTEMAHKDSNVATVGTPAVLTLMPASIPSSADPDKAAYVVLNVLGFKPPAEGSVRAVVKLRDRSGAEQVLGNFGFFPANTEFRAGSAAEAQRFRFRVPEDKVRALEGAPLDLVVDLVPTPGTSADASLEFGEVKLQQ